MSLALYACLVLKRPEEGIGSPAMGVGDVCELPFSPGAEPGPLQERPVLSTTAPTPQPTKSKGESNRLQNPDLNSALPCLAVQD